MPDQNQKRPEFFGKHPDPQRGEIINPEQQKFIRRVEKLVKKREIELSLTDFSRLDSEEKVKRLADILGSQPEVMDFFRDPYKKMFVSIIGSLIRRDVDKFATIRKSLNNETFLSKKENEAEEFHAFLIDKDFITALAVAPFRSDIIRFFQRDIDNTEQNSSYDLGLYFEIMELCRKFLKTENHKALELIKKITTESSGNPREIYKKIMDRTVMNIEKEKN